MNNTTHRAAAQRRADLRVARKAKREHGVSITVTRRALVAQRVAGAKREKAARLARRPSPHHVPFTKGMDPRVLYRISELDVNAQRVAGARALPVVMLRYGMSRLFTPLSDREWGKWKRKTELALQYRRRVFRDNKGGTPLTLDRQNEMVDLELALIFLRQSSRWSASRAVHSAWQYSLFLDQLAEERDRE